MNIIPVFSAHQIGIHEIVEAVLPNLLFLDSWECRHRTATKMFGKENAASGEVLGPLLDVYGEDLKPDPRQSRKNGDIIQGLLIFLYVRLHEIDGTQNAPGT